MAGLFNVVVKELGLRERLAKAEKLSTANLQVGMDRIGRRWLQLVDLQFKQEVDPYGQPWAPLARRTVKKKRALGFRNPEAILQASGTMRKSFSYHATSRGVSVSNNRAFPDGTDASVHQFGGTAGKFTIPARPMLPFQNDLPDYWEKVAKDAITYALGRYME